MPRAAVDKGLSAFPLPGPVWGMYLCKLDGVGAPGSDGWAGSKGGSWVRKMSPSCCHLLTSCMHVSGSVGWGPVTYSSWGRQSEAGDIWPAGWAEQLQRTGVRRSHGKDEVK